MTKKQPITIGIETGKDGTEIAVRKYDGDGPEVLLIHGIGSSSGDFLPVIEHMTEFCRPISMDLRGHGQSDKPEGGYHYRDYIQDLEAVIADLGLERPIVLGHSLGGIIALMWAAMNPDVPKALIIEDSPLRSGEDFRDAFDGWLQLNSLPQELAAAWYAEKNPHWPEAIVQQRSFDMVNTARAAILELQAASLSNDGLDSFGELGNITAPLLFLQGDPQSGSMVHPDDLSSLNSMLPQMQIQFFAGAGHTIHRSHPTEWIVQVQQFVQQVGQTN